MRGAYAHELTRERTCDYEDWWREWTGHPIKALYTRVHGLRQMKACRELPVSPALARLIDSVNGECEAQQARWNIEAIVALRAARAAPLREVEAD